MLKWRFVLFCLVWASLCHSYSEGLSPKEALERLLLGNQRFMQDRLEHPDRTEERRMASRSLQAPYAVIVSCSDSRVAPEILFDAGVGDLFVVRVAGNAIGQLELESVLYAVIVLKSALILVMGHENCGAVKEILAGNTEEIPALAELIGPAIQEAKESKSSLEDAVKANAQYMRDLLLESDELKTLAGKKKLEIRAAYYHLKTGEAKLLD